jgi:hypothetical protein
MTHDLQLTSSDYDYGFIPWSLGILGAIWQLPNLNWNLIPSHPRPRVHVLS